MAKKSFSWLTPAATAFLVGVADQQLIHQASVGNLGGLSPVPTQAAFGGVFAVAGGLGVLLSKREGTFTRVSQGALDGAMALLGQSAMHQGDQLMAKQAAKKAAASNNGGSTAAAQPTTTTAASGSTASSASGSTATSGTTATAAITDSSDLSNAFNG